MILQPLSSIHLLQKKKASPLKIRDASQSALRTPFGQLSEQKWPISNGGIVKVGSHNLVTLKINRKSIQPTLHLFFYMVVIMDLLYLIYVNFSIPLRRRVYKIRHWRVRFILLTLADLADKGVPLILSHYLALHKM